MPSCIWSSLIYLMESFRAHIFDHLIQYVSLRVIIGQKVGWPPVFINPLMASWGDWAQWVMMKVERATIASGFATSHENV